MPVFGDYETIGGPWFMSGRHGQIRSYWRATNRVLEDGRVYFIKSIALPGPESPQEQTADGPSLADPGTDFLESATRLQEAYRAYPELIAPIHAFGRTDTEVWYATDLYLRHSLAEFESSAADIDNRSLEHVVYCVASGCLALQRATGRSHGNLKASNVLLAGEPGPLRRAPIRLIDPAGSASKNPQGLPAGNVRDVTERRDLRGIGEIILSLVESNPIDGPEDYTLPIEHSAPWRALGKHSQRWRDLCNRLLDPDLSLDEISLESLAKDLSPRSTRTPVFFAGLSLTAVLAIASYLFWAQPLKQATKQTDNPRASDSAVDIPFTSQRVASVPAKTDPGSIDPIDFRTQKFNPGPAEIASPTPAIGRAASPFRAQAPDSGAPAESSTGAATSNSDPVNSQDTESTAQRTISGPVYSDTAPAPSNPQGIGLESKDTAAPPAPDSSKGSQSAVNMPSTSQEVASLSANTDAAVESIDSRRQAVDTGPPEIASVPLARDATASGVTTQALGSGAPGRSSTWSAPRRPAPSKPQRIASGRRDTASTEQTRVSDKPVYSARPPASSKPQRIASGRRETESAARTVSAKPKPSQVLQGRERVPAQQSGQREAKAERPRSARPVEQPAKGSRSQAEMARAGPGKGRTLAQVENPTPPPRIDMAKLNKELRELEAEVARVIAIRQNSELFARVDALEAQYAKANQLSGKTKRRFDFLRLNMARKLPRPLPERPSIEPFIPPVVGR